jgi:uncharacterized sporulation protein YeaH/YhbH (DUF444 family)
MKLNEVIEIQIDTAIAGLMRTRAKIAGKADVREDLDEIDRQLETVAFHLQDIQYNWLSLMQNRQA